MPVKGRDGRLSPRPNRRNHTFTTKGLRAGWVEMTYGYKILRPEMTVAVTMTKPSKLRAFWEWFKNAAIETFYLLGIALAITVIIHG